MRIFAHDKRARVVGLKGKLDDSVDTGIHGTDDVAGQAASRPIGSDCALVMNRARGVISANPTRHQIMIGAVSRFVAQRPDDDRWMIFIALHHARAAFHESRAPFRRVAQAVVESVCLEIGLIPYIDAIFIAQIVPARVVGVMAGAHGVDVVLFHQADVCQHRVHRYGFTAALFVFVTVNAANVNWTSVDEQLPILYLHAAESDAVRFVLKRRSVGGD